MTRTERRLDVGDLDLHVVEVGDGPETVVLSHSYLVDHRHFDHQIDALAERYRVVAYDHRDHGRSGRSARGYDLGRLTDDAEAVLDDAGAPVHWVGLSTGGFVGMRIGLRSPEKLRSLTLIDTSAQRDPFVDHLRHQALQLLAPIVGLRPLAPLAMRELFGPITLRDRQARRQWQRRVLDNDTTGVVRFARAIFGRDDVLADLRGLEVPTLVLHGELDATLPLARGRALAEAIPGAELEVLEGAGHISTVERPSEVTAALLRFLAAHTG